MEGLCSNLRSKNKPSKRLADAVGNSKAGNKVPASNMVRLITLLLFSVIFSRCHCFILD